MQHSPASLRFPISARLHELKLRHELIGRDYDPPRDVFPRLPPMLHLASLILKIRLEGEEKAGLFCMRSTNLHFSSNQILNFFEKFPKVQHPLRSTPGPAAARTLRPEPRGARGDDRSVKIRSLEAAKVVKIKWLVLGCIEADFCK